MEINPVASTGTLRGNLGATISCNCANVTV